MSKIYYSKTHEYAKVDGNVAVIGISDYAQHALGNVVFVDMPEQGDDVTAGEDFGAVESVKAANEVLLDNPRLVNQSPFADGWIIKVEMTDPAELDNLMDEAAYAEFCKQESH